jgi:hypothetical protein
MGGVGGYIYTQAGAELSGAENEVANGFKKINTVSHELKKRVESAT